MATQQRQKQKRIYRKITPATVVEHQAAKLEQGNGSAAVRSINPDYKRPDARSVEILSKTDKDAYQYIEDKLQQIGSKAIDRIEQLIQSPDEAIATRNAQYTVDQIRGKAVSKNFNVTLKHNIQNVLD